MTRMFEGRSINKNRKRQLRDISVNGIAYKWLVHNMSYDNTEGEVFSLKIWKGKDVIYEKEHSRYCSVSSAMVVDIILSL